MTTSDKPKTDDLSTLDFTPTCEVREPVRARPRSGELIDVTCTTPAVWMGTAPCGHDSLFCEEHHSDGRLFTCMKCGRKDTLLATYGWVRL